MAFNTPRGPFTKGFQSTTKRGFTGLKTKPYKPKATKPTLTKPGQPAPTPAPKPSPKPTTPQKPEFDKPYYDRIGNIDNRETSRLAQLEGQESSVKRDFGIDDPTNPFSRAETLKRSFLARMRGTSTSLAAQGKLYSGVHERALARVRRDEAQSRQELRDAYEKAVDQIGSAKLGTKFDSEEDRTKAFEDWLARAPEAELTATEPTPEQNAAAPKIGVLEAPKPGTPQGKPLTATAGLPPNVLKSLQKLQRVGKKSGKKTATVKPTPRRKVRESLRDA